MPDSNVFGKRYEYNNEYFANPIPFHFAQLYQIGELSCEEGFQIKEHRQPTYEISYVVTGRGTFVTNGRTCAVAENDVFINVPGQVHAIRANRGTPLRFCYLGFTFLGGQSADAELEQFYRSCKSERAAQNSELLTFFAQAFEELHYKGDFYLTMLGAYVEQIIVCAYRAFGGRNMQREITAADSRTGNAAYAVMRYVDRHYREITDIREVAAQLGYSYTYLAHVFKEKMNMTIGGYIIRKKMDEAKWLLRTGRMNVSQVAARLGYMSVQSFSNSFKKSVGVSPAEYMNLSAQEAQKLQDKR